MQPIRKTSPVLLFVMLLSAPQTDVRAEVEWQIAPYLWAADVGADVTINNDPVLGTTVPFSDLVDKLDSALMLHVEGRGSESDIGGFFDLISMDLSDSNIIPVGPGGPILGDLVTTAALSMSLYEGAVTFRFGAAASTAITPPQPGRKTPVYQQNSMGTKATRSKTAIITPIVRPLRRLPPSPTK